MPLKSGASANRTLFRLAVGASSLLWLVACGGSGGGGGSTADAEVTVETVVYADYNLYGNLTSTTAYLVDEDGTAVHSWETSHPPGHSMYLLENGELLRTGDVGNTTFEAGGAGGIVETYDWDGNLTWSYTYSDTTHLQHHDVEWLPNGNVLLLAWQYKSGAEAIAAGRDPGTLATDALWPDSVIEVQPDGEGGGTIVWEWHVWDHLVQDYDAAKPNYGVVADHPELIDLNYTMNSKADWNHSNSVDYNAELDQILISVRNFSEIWIIDHSTTTAEAASHSGGTSGKGGDLLYRWGNPQAWDAGGAEDQQLFVQHDAEWIASGLSGEDNILVYNNGNGRSDGDYSTVDEIAPPLAEDGSYTRMTGSAFGPSAVTWRYQADPATDFYSSAISGAQRLPNGNTLICEGQAGRFFEVTDAGEIVWEYEPGGSVFRVERYRSDYAGFDGTPLDDGV
jgi:hypothetical protein